jgi:thioredoxin 1
MTDRHRNSAVIPVNELNFEQEVLAAELPVLIDVSADWCGPCKAAAPVVAALAESHRGRIKVVEIDGGESPNLASRLGVRGYPTFVAVSRGEIVALRAGFGGRRQLDALVSALLEAQPSAAPA